MLKFAQPIVLGKMINKSKSGDHEVLKDWTIHRFYSQLFINLMDRSDFLNLIFWFRKNVKNVWTEVTFEKHK